MTTRHRSSPQSLAAIIGGFIDPKRTGLVQASQALEAVAS